MLRRPSSETGTLNTRHPVFPAPLLEYMARRAGTRTPGPSRESEKAGRGATFVGWSSSHPSCYEALQTLQHHGGSVSNHEHLRERRSKQKEGPARSGANFTAAGSVLEDARLVVVGGLFVLAGLVTQVHRPRSSPSASKAAKASTVLGVCYGIQSRRQWRSRPGSAYVALTGRSLGGYSQKINPS